MDFASLMSAEISKKRPTPTPTTSEPSKKYQKRSEVEADRRAAYLASQRALEAEKEANALAKRKREEEEARASREREEKRLRLAEESRVRREEKERGEERARRKRLGLPELVVEDKKEDEVEEDDLPDEDLVEKLRGMGEPAKLFGETHKARLRRWRKLGTVMTTGPIPTSLELVEEKDMKVESVPEDAEGKKYLFRQLASYFTMVLREWEEALEKEKRDTFASKAAYNAMVQSKENMTPVCTIFTHPYTYHSLTPFSFSASSKPPPSNPTSSRPSLRSSKQRKSAATSTPTTATCVSASARQLGPSASPWWVFMSVVRERSCMRVIRDM
jgi:pre-mRNA-splicing factor 18